jgi:hypothetical protein
VLSSEQPAIREALLNLVDHEQTIHRLTKEFEHARLAARSALWRTSRTEQHRDPAR